MFREASRLGEEASGGPWARSGACPDLISGFIVVDEAMSLSGNFREGAQHSLPRSLSQLFNPDKARDPFPGNRACGCSGSSSDCRIRVKEVDAEGVSPQFAAARLKCPDNREDDMECSQHKQHGDTNDKKA